MDEKLKKRMNKRVNDEILRTCEGRAKREARETGADYLTSVCQCISEYREPTKAPEKPLTMQPEPTG